jgi:hypothetical protein
MSGKTIHLLDQLSRALLMLWCAFSAVIVLFFSPHLNSLGARVDITAWFAFGLALIATTVSRWLAEIDDSDPIGPLRLWSAAALAALLICMASTFIVGPKMRVEAVASKASSAFRQMLFLRMLVAAGLAAGIRYLPLAPNPQAGEGSGAQGSDPGANS